MPTPQTIYHPVVAALIDVAMRPLYRFRTAVIPFAEGAVIEIGAGTGLNFPLYDPTHIDRLCAVEPDAAMRARAQKRACRLPVEWVSARAEELPFDDGSFDTAVLTFVLCSIDDPPSALREVRRVLKPGGTLLFAEHVRSTSSLTARIQGTLTPLWRRCAGGCHLNRDARGEIEAAGFVIDTIERRGSSRTLSPVAFGQAHPGR